MDMFRIHGGSRLRGQINISGAKNAALPIMAACLLSDKENIIRHVPKLADVRHLGLLLEKLGAKLWRDDNNYLHIKVEDESQSLADYESVRRMRASICVLGPLLARRGQAEVSMPGGCAIGDRPVNLHLRAMEKLGAKITLESGNIIARADRLHGTDIFLGGPFGSTVLGTANVMTAAVLAEGTTIIEAAACEPEIQDLGDFLNKMGAKITGHGTPHVVIEGVDELNAVDYTIIPDRIEAGTFMIAAAITNGELLLKNCLPSHLMALTDRLAMIGVDVEAIETDLLQEDSVGEDKATEKTVADSRAVNGKVTGGTPTLPQTVTAPTAVRVSSARRLLPADITTQPYPGFPTDLQAQLMALLCLADGNSIITEKIFPDRFMHTAELNRMGAKIRKEGPTAVVEGVKELIGAPVMASDLRASAALVLAGMAARGQTEIRRVYHIDRGYERIEEKLNAVGAQIERLQE